MIRRSAFFLTLVSSIDNEVAVNDCYLLFSFNSIQGWLKAEDYPLLEAHYQRVKALPNISKYISSSSRYPARQLEKA